MAHGAEVLEILVMCTRFWWAWLFCRRLDRQLQGQGLPFIMGNLQLLRLVFTICKAHLELQTSCNDGFPNAGKDSALPQEATIDVWLFGINATLEHRLQLPTSPMRYPSST